MWTTHNAILVSFIGAGSLALACGGGQTGDLGGLNGGSESSGSCVETEHTLDGVNSETELGFSAAELLARVEGTYEASLAWGTEDAIDFSPRDATTNVTFIIECPDPNPRFVGSEPRQSGGLVAAEPELGDSCPDQLRVDCELAVTTDDGGLDENWTVVVNAASLDIARIDHALEPDAFAGSFEIGDPRAENTEVKQLSLEMSVSRFGVSGSIASVLESRMDSAVSAGWVSYARWPTQTCEGVSSNAFVVDENSDAEGASADAIVEQLVPDAERSVDWGDGEESTLSLAVLPMSTGCVEFDPYEEGLTAYYPATVEASSDDGRLELTGEGNLRASFDAEGELSYATIQVDQVPSSEQVAALMASSVDEAEQLASEYDELELSLTQTFDVNGAMGYVRLLGAIIPDCIKNPPEPMQDENGGGSAGCMGIDQQVVFEGTWTP